MTRGYIFDLDGTVYLGDQLISGAVETIKHLRDNGDKVVFLTNKPISTRNDYMIKLKKLGIDVKVNEIINSNYITAKYLKERLTKDDAVFVVGEDPLFEELSNENIRTTTDPDQANFVVLSWDRQFTYEKLNIAYQAWFKNKATIVATNPDRTCPVYGGQVPDCGAIIGAVEGATGQPIDYVIGKPSDFTAQFIVHEVLKLKPEECYMVGDRLETDIRMGNENGLKTILVLTGITKKTMVNESHDQPTYTMDSIKDIIYLNKGSQYS
ncbi:arabinose operon protein AraL [Virgibacillus halotolerans]|uniref:HAD-IIA family hydrolase n=1 Tax=Virgibacillus halotolerans TaxID=1071053 RepID=UPI00195F5051|nr:HAD-IIA family hydrolase [Virgibacillus halotolerans]MBM7600091.1 arabinose operon protein AraL [Virgibacillus halotolerans]